MFCEKCGKPVEGDQPLCSSCAAEETPISPDETAVDTFALNTAEDIVPVKKASKKKKGLIAGIIALVVAAAAAACIFFNVGNIAGTIEGFFGRTFQEPEEYLADVEGDAITQYTGELTNAYGAWLDAYSSSVNFDAANMELGLILGDDLLAYAESYLQQQGMTMDLDFLKDVNLSVDANIQESALQAVLGLGLGNTELLSADMIVDMDQSMLYLGLPAISKTYLSGDLSYEMDFAEVEEALNMSMEMNQALIKALPSEDELSTLISTYVDIVLTSIDNVEKENENETVTVDDVSQEMVVLTAKITAKDMLEIAEKALKKAEKDKTLEAVLTDLNGFVNEIGKRNSYTGYYEPVDLYEEFINAIPDALEELSYMKESADSGNYIKLKVYVDMQNAVRGHVVNIYTDGEKMDEEISLLSAAKGDTVYYEAEIPGFKVTGEETTKKGVSEGKYVLYVEGQKLGAVEFENVTENSGTLRLVPSEELMEQAMSGSGVPAALLGGNIALEVSYGTNSNETGLTVKILAGSKDLVGLSLTSKPAKGGEIKIPSNTLDMDSASENDIMRWVQSMDFSSVIKALKDAKVPTEIVDALEGLTASMQPQY